MKLMKRVNQTLAYLPYEAKRIYARPLLIVWLAIFLLMLVVTYTGINDYFNSIEKNKKIEEIQKTSFNLNSNYLVYGIRGLMYNFSPSANKIFTRHTVIPPDMTAQVDSCVKVSIYSNMKGKSLVTNSFLGPFDLFLILFLFMTFMAQYYGYDSFHTPEYLKFLASLSSKKRMIISILASRFILFAAGFIVLCSGIMGLCLVRGVVFTSADKAGLMAMFGAGMAVLLFFFALGTLFGTFLKNNTRVIAFTLTWIFLALIPFSLFTSLIDNQFKDTLEAINTELNKIKEGIDYENKVKSDNKKPDTDNPKEAREIFEHYMDNYYKKIKSAEQKQMENIHKQEIEKLQSRIKDAARRVSDDIVAQEDALAKQNNLVDVELDDNLFEPVSVDEIVKTEVKAPVQNAGKATVPDPATARTNNNVITVTGKAQRSVVT